MLRAELRELLREFAVSTGASSVAIAHPEEDDGEPDEGDSLVVPVGGGAFLCARFTAPEPSGEPLTRAAALERAARALRACARRFDVSTLPPVAYPEGPATDRLRVLERIETYLRAFAGTQNTRNAILVVSGAPVASALPVEELERERVPFIVKRVDAEAVRLRGESSHATVAGDDFFAASFYVGAHLVAFFDGPWATDFVRHRARLVTRELAHLLALLDEPPPDPAVVAPLPE